MGKLAFICHSNLDSAIANKIVVELEKAGITCWIAPRNIQSGTTYAAAIVQGIKKSNLLILIFTVSSNKSDAVINEIENASALKIPIIPFKVHKEAYSDSLEYYIRSRQSINAYDKSIDQAIVELILSIDGKIPPPPPPPPSFRKWLIPAGIGLLLVSSLIIYFLNNPRNNKDTISNVADSSKIDAIIRGTKDSIRIPPQEKIAVSIESNDIPAITGVGAKGFCFFRKTSKGQIEYSSGQLGGAGSSWQLINDNIINGSSPSAAAINNFVYLVTRNDKNAVLLSLGTFEGSFGPWLNMNFYTDDQPEITAVAQTFYYFTKKPDGHIFYNYARPNMAGTGWKEVDGNIIAASAPSAGAAGNHVFVAVRGTDNKIYYNQADLEKPFNDRWDVMPSFETKFAPTVVGVGNMIYFFAVNIKGEVWYNRAQLSHSFEGWKVVDGNGVTDNPIMAGTAGAENYIFLVMKGQDGNFYLNQGFDRFQERWAILK